MLPMNFADAAFKTSTALSTGDFAHPASKENDSAIVATDMRIPIPFLFNGSLLYRSTANLQYYKPLECDPRRATGR